MALEDHKVVAIVGGVGGAKLALGLSKLLPPENLTIIVNTGDDFWHYGLRICPDLDTVMYTLSGLVNPETGWGVQDDRSITMEALGKYGEKPWFFLGDKDLATHLLRTTLLRNGQTLTQITRRLTQELGIESTVLPMTNDTVATIVDTVEHGELEFQSYFVRYRWQPVVQGLEYRGAETASVTEEVWQAIQNADILMVGPSNPWLSIQPIFSIPSLYDLIRGNERLRRVAITPIIDGKALKGPAAKIMAELGYEVSPQTVAEYYRDVIDGFIYDEKDTNFVIDDMRSIALNTIMHTTEEKINLSKKIIHWIEEWDK